MLKIRVAQSLLPLILAATVLCAADFWQKKKYSEWSQKEVQEILNDSPWAKKVEIIMGNISSGDGGGRRAPSTSTDRSGRGGSTGRDSESIPRATLVIRFHSALPVKQAVARGRFGDEVLTSPDAAKMLARQEEAILIGITGSPRLLAADPAELRNQTRLVIKGKDPIAPETLVIDRERGGPAIYIAFPRASSPIKLEDESFELQIKLPAYQLKQRFKLKEMVFDGKLEM